MASLNAEFYKFNSCINQLRRIYKETLTAFLDASNSSSIDFLHSESSGALVSDWPPREIFARLEPPVEAELQQLLHQPPTLLVFGQSRCARNHLANHLLHCCLLPLGTSANEDDADGPAWRPVRLRFSAASPTAATAAALDEADLRLPPDCGDSTALVLEVPLNHPLLRDGAELLVAGDGDFTAAAPPLICLCALPRERCLTPAEARDLQQLLSTAAAPSAVLIARPPPPPAESANPQLAERLRGQLRELGLPDTAEAKEEAATAALGTSATSELLDDFQAGWPRLVAFVRRALQRILVRAAVLLNQAHCAALNNFILLAFDLSRDLMVTPRKIQFAQRQEQQLFDSLCEVADSKQEEMRQLVAATLSGMRESLLTAAAEYQFAGGGSEGDCRRCEFEIRELVMSRLGVAIGEQLVRSVSLFRDAYAGTLTRCLEGLEDGDCSATEALRRIISAAYQVEVTARSGSSYARSFRNLLRELDASWRRRVASDMLDGLSDQRLARHMCAHLSERIRAAHEAFLVAMRQLEERKSARTRACEEQRDRIRCRHAPRIARLALESASVRDMTLYGMPQFSREIGRGQYGIVYSCDSWGGRSPVAIKSVVPPDDKHWNDLALEFYYTQQLPEHARVARILGCAIDRRLAEPAVLLAMARLPRDLHVALGRGLAWTDRQLPPHERIVPVLGVVTNYAYGGGGVGSGDGGLTDSEICVLGASAAASPEILIISELMGCDLHRAIQFGSLSFAARLQVACDVVEGIRFLHSRGLVHRDVKLKNVLLDRRSRAKLTDLGFCKPHAMMSGSIVGTPIHMPPELFTGSYDSSVDVYAFGILFWYVCADTVRLPHNFEQCSSKDALWSSVKRGVRPERLPAFTDQCWDLMRHCWDGLPDRRPLPGDLLPTLQALLAEARAAPASPACQAGGPPSGHLVSDLL
uniref:Dual serine/threonine and tyrosine protein kinase n=1 Tax=Macrostomum lignano TaxID=282301 RepID=A0A1I8G620_9PLAT